MSRILDQLDRARMTALHRRLAWAAGLGIFLDGYDLTIIGAVLLLLKPQWRLTAYDTGWLGSAALAGAFAGALLGGRVADRFGRKAIYVLDLLTFFLAAILCAAAWNVVALVIFRFFLGMGIGADYPLSATYMAEFMPATNRGGVITWTFGLWSAGAIIAGLVGFVLVTYGGPESWRVMFVCGALPALIVIWLRRNLPESPRWYLRRGQTENAVAVLRRLNPAVQEDEITRMLAERQKALATPRRPTSILFSRRFLRATLLVCGPWFIMDFVGYYATVYTPQILGRLGFHGAPNQMLGTVAISASFLIGYIPLALSIDKIGRIWPQIIGFVVSGAGWVLVGITALQAPLKPQYVHGVWQQVPQFGLLAFSLIFAGMLIAQILNSFGPGITTYVLASEVYPTDVRATGHGFATAFSRLGAVASTFLLPPLAAKIGIPALLIWLGAGSALGGVVTWLFRVETTNQPLPQDAATDHAP